MIDKSNHHLFQPLLYQVATGFLGINDIAFATRSEFRNRKNVQIVMQKVTNILPDKKIIVTESNEFTYDYLVLATGSRYNYFGHSEWEDKTFTLKTLDDAILLRQKILSSLEKAELEKAPDLRNQYLTYIVIGGGPTGVEMAGAIADVANYAIEREFKNFKRKDVRIYLLEAGPRLLSAFDKNLSAYARDVLIQKGVSVVLGATVTEIGTHYIRYGNQLIDSEVILWAAGVAANPLAPWLGVEPGRNGTIEVTDKLNLAGHSEIYVLGDACLFLQDGKPLPALASVAKQQGEYAAKAIKAALCGAVIAPFHYKDLGTMATIGRNAAVLQVDSFRMKGWFAWAAWGIVHIFFLTGFRNRITVFLTWIWSYLTYGISSRIIISPDDNGK